MKNQHHVQSRLLAGVSKLRGSLAVQFLLIVPGIALSQQAAVQTFTSSGTFTVPAGVTRVSVQLWGGGGAGAAGLTGLASGIWAAGNSATEVGGGGSSGWDNYGDNNVGDGTRGGDGFRGQVVIRYRLRTAAK